MVLRTSKTQIEPAIKQNEQRKQNRVLWIMYRRARSLHHLLTSRRQVSKGGKKATHTGRMTLAVPKSAIIALARCRKVGSDSQTPTNTTLCLFNKDLPKACLLPATDARDATDWQLGKSMLGTRTNSQDARMKTAFLNDLAKGSVGIMMIKNPPPQGKGDNFCNAKVKTARRIACIRDIKKCCSSARKVEEGNAQQSRPPRVHQDLRGRKRCCTATVQRGGEQKLASVRKKEAQGHRQSNPDKHRYNSNTCGASPSP